MSLLKSLSKLFSSRKPAPVEDAGGPFGPIETSRFGSVSDRLNREHWSQAIGESINNDLVQRLPALQARSAFEYGTNPDFEGVCNTFKDDVVGRDGPMLQVMSTSSRFNELVEAGFREVFADPDPSHRYGGVEDMRTWVQGLLLAGSYYNVNTNTNRIDSQMTFGWRSVHARRFVTPAQHSGNPHVAFGCRYSDVTGEPIEYYLQRPQRYGGAQILTGEFDTIPAAAVQHCFIPAEPEQLTGYPMMSSTLDTAADLRELDKYVLQSIKLTAANAPYLQNTHPEATVDPDPVPPGSVRYEPGEIAVAPMGWAWSSPNANQPTAQYLPFKHEKAAELGRPLHMPLLVVLLTAAGANFSSAQYEGTVYADGIATVQGFIERRSLIPFVIRGIIPEVMFRNRVALPKSFELVWTWNVPAHANIEKFAKAVRMMLEDGLISQAQAAGLFGRDWEKVVASREKCQEILEKKGLPLPPVNSGNAQPEQPEEENEETEETNQPGGRTSARRFSLA